MNFEKMERHVNEWRRVKAVNDRRTAEKFAECEKWVASHLINCGVVWTRHEDDLRQQRFLVWKDLGGLNVAHNYFTFESCGITPLELLPFPEYH